MTVWRSAGRRRKSRHSADTDAEARHVQARSAGWLSHYPMAFGYAYQERTVRYCFIWCWTDTVYDRWFYVNQGWGGRGNDWVSASTWFAGEIFP